MSSNGTSEMASFFVSYTAFATYRVLLYILWVFGVSGNVISVMILSIPQMRSPFNVNLIFLLAYETMFLCGEAANEVLPGTNRHKSWIISLKYIAWTSSVWSTVALASERYIAVCHPFRVRNLCSYSRIMASNVLVLFLSLCFNIPRFCFLEKISWEESEVALLRTERHGTGLLFSPHVPPWFPENRLLYEICYNYLDNVVMYAVPMLVLAVMNIKIFITVKRAESTRHKISSRHQKESSVTKTLIAIVFIFLLCYSPIFIFTLSYYISYSPTVSKIEVFAPILRTANSSVNFIIYCVARRDFRGALVQLLCRSKNSDTSVSDTTVELQLESLEHSKVSVRE